MVEMRGAFRDCRIGRPSLRLWLAQWAALGLVLACIPAGHAQANGNNGGQSGSRVLPFGARPDSTYPGDAYGSLMIERRMHALNMERQKEMVADTNKLLKLARELNAEVAAQKSDTLTPEQLHKVAEIEKLARSVKDRMTSSIGPAQPTLASPMAGYPF